MTLMESMSKQLYSGHLLLEDSQRGRVSMIQLPLCQWMNAVCQVFRGGGSVFVEDTWIHTWQVALFSWGHIAKGGRHKVHGKQGGGRRNEIVDLSDMG